MNFRFKRYMFFILVIVLLFFVIGFYIYKFVNLNNNSKFNILDDSNNNNDINQYYSVKNELTSLNTDIDSGVSKDDKNQNKKYIKWVDYKCTAPVMSKLSNLDISSHVNNEDIKFNWIELMAYLGSKYGGDFKLFKQSDLDDLINKLKSGSSMSELAQKYKTYSYFYETYDSIFHNYIGDYTIQVNDGNGNKSYKTSYGLKAFSPFAKGYTFNHYEDFGVSRSYGYKRVHLGNDLLRQYWYSNLCY